MTNDDKILLIDYVLRFISEKEVNSDIPVMIGTLKEPTGIKGFDKCQVGHPVFELKDRYIIYMDSDRELTEKVYDHERQQFNTKIGFFKVAIPYYKEALSPIIDFLK